VQCEYDKRNMSVVICEKLENVCLLHMFIANILTSTNNHMFTNINLVMIGLHVLSTNVQF
jgi:hypothetical protein